MRDSRFAASSRHHALATFACMALRALGRAAMVVHAGIAPAAQPDAWLDAARAHVAAAEYRFAPDPAGTAFTAPCRAQGFRASWSSGFLTLRPRVSEAQWSLEIQTLSVGRDGAPLRAPPAPVADAADALLTLRHSWGIETLVNAASGASRTRATSTATAPQTSQSPRRCTMPMARAPDERFSSEVL